MESFLRAVEKAQRNFVALPESQPTPATLYYPNSNTLPNELCLHGSHGLSAESTKDKVKQAPRAVSEKLRPKKNSSMIIITFAFHLCQSVSVIILFPEGLVPLSDSLQNGYGDHNDVNNDGEEPSIYYVTTDYTGVSPNYYSIIF